MKQQKHEIGILRLLLILFTVALSVIGLFAQPSTEIEGWPVLFSIVAPSLVVMLVFTMTLDLVMNIVFRMDSSNQERTRLKKIIKIELSSLILLLICWSAFTIKLFENPIG
tara:strand:+ start:132 stop:464 length:333 start_codon:yes stop_codon:yes gene_type:complete